jgi:hypothetical protein
MSDATESFEEESGSYEEEHEASGEVQQGTQAINSAENSESF